MKDELCPLLRSRDEPMTSYPQHDDPDVVIPDDISRALVISAHLFLIMAILCFVYSIYLLAVLSSFLYLTSIWHWHKPRFSSYARRVDYLAVLAVITYASYYATTEAEVYTIVWFVGFGILSCIFVLNEYRYYCQAMKTPTGKDSTDDNNDSYNDICNNNSNNSNDSFGWFTPTKPNTIERDYVYRRTVITHCIGVHCLGFVLACVIIVLSHYYPNGR